MSERQDSPKQNAPLPPIPDELPPVPTPANTIHPLAHPTQINVVGWLTGLVIALVFGLIGFAIWSFSLLNDQRSQAVFSTAEVQKLAEGKSTAEGFTAEPPDSSRDWSATKASYAAEAALIYPTAGKITAYRAQIGPHDLRNSKGVFLPEVYNIQARDILLQDRFNYHQMNLRDPQDTDEGVYKVGKEIMRKMFESKEARVSGGGDPIQLLRNGGVFDVLVTHTEIVIEEVR
jgi:hypothetical protein